MNDIAFSIPMASESLPWIVLQEFAKFTEGYHTTVLAKAELLPILELGAINICHAGIAEVIT